MKPEEEAEIILWDWLKTKGQNIKEVYFNRENILGWKKFRVEGIQKKPDFIVCCDNGYGKSYIAIEIKSSDNSRDILSARKIIDYLKNYLEKKTVYFVGNDEIKIKHFVIATENSRKGYLFWNETLVDNLAQPENTSKNYATNLKIIPRFEGNRTFEFIRTLWNIYSDTKNNYEEKCGIGILIGDLDIPKVMITSYNATKKRWGQRWWTI